MYRVIGCILFWLAVVAIGLTTYQSSDRAMLASLEDSFYDRGFISECRVVGDGITCWVVDSENTIVTVEVDRSYEQGAIDEICLGM